MNSKKCEYCNFELTFGPKMLPRPRMNETIRKTAITRTEQNLQKLRDLPELTDSADVTDALASIDYANSVLLQSIALAEQVIEAASAVED